MPDAAAWITAVRRSHERFTALVTPLDATAVRGRSYAREWSIAQVASHLGSQAEIFGLFLDAGLSGAVAPGAEQFAPIWGEWNVRNPQQQVSSSVVANAQFVERLESLADDEIAGFSLDAFGRQLDLAGLLVMRLGEHAVHTWDIAVALDPGAVVAADALELLVDTLPAMATRVGTASENPRALGIDTVDPVRRFVLSTGPEVTLTPAEGSSAAELALPAEALLRLIYGRLDAEHTPTVAVGADLLEDLRPVFPGF